MPATAATTKILERLRDDPSLAGLRRSLEIYYGDAARNRAMDELYARFLKRGDLAFDIGSHVGGRVGARVVALEPQPDCARVVGAVYGADALVTVVEAACGVEPGKLKLYVNTANPTVTTASQAFLEAADGAGGWEGQTWDREIEVPVTTLDLLIASHGMPDFVKIDVEGFEADVLAGLSRPPKALSFEFTTIQRDVARACIERLLALGPYRFDVALGETQRLVLGRWVSGREMAAHIETLPHAANSGDIYAVLAP